MSTQGIVQVKFERIHPDAKLPTRASDGRAYYDIYTIEDVTLTPEKVVLAHTGLKVQPPFGWFIDIRPRSGLALKGITVNNSPGTIDSDYGGELMVELIWHIPEHSYGRGSHPTMNLSDDTSYIINKGERIAQLGVLPCFEIDWIESNFEGTGGFGSTGK